MVVRVIADANISTTAPLSRNRNNAAPLRQKWRYQKQRPPVSSQRNLAKSGASDRAPAATKPAPAGSHLTSGGGRNNNGSKYRQAREINQTLRRAARQRISLLRCQSQTFTAGPWRKATSGSAASAEHGGLSSRRPHAHRRYAAYLK